MKPSSVSGHSWVFPWLAAAIFIGCWEALVNSFDIARYLLPSPHAIYQAAALRIESLLLDTLITLSEAFAGFIIGSSLAFVVGSIFAHFRRIERALSPMFVALQAVPLVAIAPLLIVWMGNGFMSKATMAALVCFFPMVVATFAGLSKAAPESEDLMTALGSSEWQRFRLLRLPNSVPFLFAGLKVNASLAVIGAIVSELAGAGQGIGFQILMASYRTDTPTLFAAIFFASMSGIIFFKFIETLERVFGRRYV
jgi:NitT/TauT family transport system permease protein